MKYLVRFNKEDNSFIDMQTVNEEYIHKYYEVEELEQLEQKQGFYVSYEYDKKQEKVIGKYIEIPKSEVELLREQVEANSKAVEDVIMGLQG